MPDRSSNMVRSNVLAIIFAVGAAVVASLVLSEIFRLAEVPGIVVAGVAITNAGLLALGVALAVVVENW
jgi:hypothetical protein